MSILRARELRGGYGASEVIRGVSLELAPGHCLALVGPNGAGKSTLLRLLAGVLPASAGSVVLMDRPLSEWRRRDVARVMGLVPQIVSFTFPLSVRELVEQGRSPHLGPWRPPGRQDTAVVNEALGRVPIAGKPDQAQLCHGRYVIVYHLSALLQYLCELFLGQTWPGLQHSNYLILGCIELYVSIVDILVITTNTAITAIATSAIT